MKLVEKAKFGMTAKRTNGTDEARELLKAITAAGPTRLPPPQLSSLMITYQVSSLDEAFNRMDFGGPLREEDGVRKRCPKGREFALQELLPLGAGTLAAESDGDDEV